MTRPKPPMTPPGYPKPTAVWESDNDALYPEHSLYIRGPVPEGFATYERHLMRVDCLGPRGKRRIAKRAIWAWNPGMHVLEAMTADEAKAEAVIDAHRSMARELKRMEQQTAVLKAKVDALAALLPRS